MFSTNSCSSAIVSIVVYNICIFNFYCNVFIYWILIASVRDCGLWLYALVYDFYNIKTFTTGFFLLTQSQCYNINNMTELILQHLFQYSVEYEYRSRGM